MGSIRRALILCACALAGVGLVGGCFAVADLDRFHGPSDAGGGDPTADDAGADSSARD